MAASSGQKRTKTSSSFPAAQTAATTTIGDATTLATNIKSMADLPEEMLLEIFKRIPTLNSLLSARHVNRQWNRLCSPLLAHFFKTQVNIKIHSDSEAFVARETKVYDEEENVVSNVVVSLHEFLHLFFPQKNPSTNSISPCFTRFSLSNLSPEYIRKPEVELFFKTVGPHIQYLEINLEDVDLAGATFLLGLIHEHVSRVKVLKIKRDAADKYPEDKELENSFHEALNTIPLHLPLLKMLELDDNFNYSFEEKPEGVPYSHFIRRIIQASPNLQNIRGRFNDYFMFSPTELEFWTSEEIAKAHCFKELRLPPWKIFHKDYYNSWNFSKLSQINRLEKLSLSSPSGQKYFCHNNSANEVDRNLMKKFLAVLLQANKNSLSALKLMNTPVLLPGVEWSLLDNVKRLRVESGVLKRVGVQFCPSVFPEGSRNVAGIFPILEEFDYANYNEAPEADLLFPLESTPVQVCGA